MNGKTLRFAPDDPDEMSVYQARAYAKELQPYYPSATVSAWPVAQGLAYVRVVYPWASGLPDFVLKTRGEVMALLIEERRQEGAASSRPVGG